VGFYPQASAATFRSCRPSFNGQGIRNPSTVRRHVSYIIVFILSEMSSDSHTRPATKEDAVEFKKAIATGAVKESPISSRTSIQMFDSVSMKVTRVYSSSSDTLLLHSFNPYDCCEQGKVRPSIHIMIKFSWTFFFFFF
jgi:hypothetical protein